MKFLFTLLFLLGMTGCSTIYFHRHSNETTATYEEWHHDGILGFVEFSDPVDLRQRCQGTAWKTVKTEETFVQGLVGAITYRLYDPWMASYTCEQGPAFKPKKALKKAKS